MDHQVGVGLDRLESLGAKESTIVLLHADHGWVSDPFLSIVVTSSDLSVLTAAVVANAAAVSTRSRRNSVRPQNLGECID